MKTTGFDCMKCGGVGTYGVDYQFQHHDGSYRQVSWRCSFCLRGPQKREAPGDDGVPLPESLVTWLVGDFCCQRSHVPPVDTGWIVDGPRFSLWDHTYVDEDNMVAHLTGGDK